MPIALVRIGLPIHGKNAGGVGRAGFRINIGHRCARRIIPQYGYDSLYMVVNLCYM
ncbi:hypothetical protein NX02_20275 [Sphingomonas sanxanigenens DSM 19645 = NX02]|uniref:Uncharacterized protein n=1 Tax=Sphingomonas sanxanigenens DSM 19645 = NX02 TaxID=1123269 RepID=W0AGP4_9SPHN|nr:hypothetical protein NX02_20275 [Sphingomonas sanxanigenens DSM 19645 = NX02]